MSVVSLETADDASIEWLNPGCKIWCEKDQLNVCWLVGDVVARKVVEMKADFPLLLPHHIVECLEPPVIM